MGIIMFVIDDYSSAPSHIASDKSYIGLAATIASEEHVRVVQSEMQSRCGTVMVGSHQHDPIALTDLLPDSNEPQSLFYILGSLVHGNKFEETFRLPQLRPPVGTHAL